MSSHCACIVSFLRCIVCQSVTTWLHLFVLKGFWMINQQLVSGLSLKHSRGCLGENRASSVWTMRIIDYFCICLTEADGDEFYLEFDVGPSTHRKTEEVREWQQGISDKAEIIISVAHGKLSGFGSGCSSQWVNLCGAATPNSAVEFSTVFPDWQTFTFFSKGSLHFCFFLLVFPSLNGSPHNYISLSHFRKPMYQTLKIWLNGLYCHFYIKSWE